ncbi:hypothetical protein BKA67DRAFT_573430 [Truncatella angustata]|uniref:NB-ARC domain-containing protein n=1 Tax=Truncatella angustata TaxID=152316 RepID=A0A9P8ZVR3_9PEZI|nr:uncharacterized protein BKA67DRAFT_573430 [Truncatella angustata]KAH6652260.1 hypothetical protein BKA67DRAFT_573430 [Truncatella angustata]
MKLISLPRHGRCSFSRAYGSVEVGHFKSFLPLHRSSFFSVNGAFLGDKTSLENEIHGVTKIKIPALRGNPLDHFSIHERMNWAVNRRTTKEEDAAYCLLGIFDVYIPLIYGEGMSNATSRLLEAIDKRSGTPNVSCRPQKRYHLAPEASPEAHLVVPFGQNDEFVGRESILTELVDKILPRSNNNDCQRTVLEGLGGVGKTQIALEAVYRVRDQDPTCSVFWVPAVTLVTFENAYREIGEVLGTSGMDNDKADIKALVRRALEKSVTNWLLIIDNIDNIGLLVEGGLQDCIPFNRKGSILFTTRNHEVAVRLDIFKKHTFLVNDMREEEALELLQNGLEERQYRDTQATKDLIEQLVCLPLAIKQASAYMARTRITTVRYLELCRTSDDTQIRLLSTDFEERRRYSKDTNPITMTWLISFQHLAQSCLLAVDYLKFICLLAEKDIMFSLLQPGEDEQAKDEAVGVLEGYAFISVREHGDSFDIHRLVRLATRNWIKNEWEACCTRVIQQLAKVYPVPKHENRQVWMRYMPHAIVTIELYHKCTDKVIAADFLFVVADSYDEVGKYDEAEQIHRQALELKKSVLGVKHPSTLDSMNNLALVLRRLGRYDEAEQMHRQTLEIRKSGLGLEHPSTLNSMNNLGLVLDNLGRYDEAEQMHRQALELKNSVLGLEHPSTLSSMNNLALVLRCLGRYDEAEQMHRQELELTKSVFGLEHPLTLDSMNNLALVLDSLGRYDEAEQIHRQELELTKSGLGLEHPSTLSSMNNLGLVLVNLGRHDEAKQIHRQTLEMRKSVLGPDHPSTIQSHNNLQDLLDSLNVGNEDFSITGSDESEGKGGAIL